MSSKSISERSAPHHGMGLARKCLRAFSLNLRIQSGSDLRWEISSTTSSERPFFGVNTEWLGSFQPKRYPLVSSLRCSSWVIAIAKPVYTAGAFKVDREPRIQNPRSEPILSDGATPLPRFIQASQPSITRAGRPVEE